MGSTGTGSAEADKVGAALQPHFRARLRYFVAMARAPAGDAQAQHAGAWTALAQSVVLHSSSDFAIRKELFEAAYTESATEKDFSESS